MKKVLLFILFTFLLSNRQYYDNLFLLSNSMAKIEDLNIIEDSITESNPKLYKNNFNKIKATVASAFLPGSGQYFMNEQKIKGIIFSSVEILGWASYRYYTNEAEKFKIDYQDYADNHWSFSSWCNHYYDYQDLNNPFRDLFSNQQSGVYSLINSGHGLEFAYDDLDGIRRYMKTNTESFGLFYSENNLDQNGVADDFVINRNITMYKTHDFYEEIVKYDQFFTGWDDQSQIQRSTNDWGQDNATSPNKSYAKTFYDKSVKNYKLQDWVMISIYVNHTISMLDALIVSSILSEAASLSYDYNPIIDFHQAEIIIKLD